MKFSKKQHEKIYKSLFDLFFYPIPKIGINNAVTVREVAIHVAEKSGILTNHTKNCQYFWECFYNFIGNKLNRMTMQGETNKPKKYHIPGLGCLITQGVKTVECKIPHTQGLYFIAKTKEEVKKIKQGQIKGVIAHQRKIEKRGKILDKYLERLEYQEKEKLDYKKEE